ncbi:hypothetical protein BDV93DRAFT_521200 [Ceratobasidium sp. AG-I]|nr:hypothetical protein BDV93DRAFT_521200 [Ceratobasidium sp. AG-I]
MLRSIQPGVSSHVPSFSQSTLRFPRTIWRKRTEKVGKRTQLLPVGGFIFGLGAPRSNIYLRKTRSIEGGEKRWVVAASSP